MKPLEQKLKDGETFQIIGEGLKAQVAIFQKQKSAKENSLDGWHRGYAAAMEDVIKQLNSFINETWS